MQLRQRARRTPPVLRHVVTHRVVFTAVVVTALITAVFTAAAVSFISAVMTVAARSELGGRPSSAIVVTATVSRGDIRHANALVTSMVHGSDPALAAKVDLSLQSGVLNLPRRKSAGIQLQTQLISLPGLAAHVRMLSGTCGGAGQDPITACVPQAAASVLGLTTGDRIRLRDTVSHAVTEVLISGVYQPVWPNGVYWKLDQLGSAAQRSGHFTEAGPLVISPAAAAGGKFAFESAVWVGQPDLARLAGANLAVLGAQLANRIAALPLSGALLGDAAQSPTLPDAIVTTNLPGQLAALATALVVTRTEMLSAILILLLVAGATLSLAVRLLAQRREAETALLAARGASRVQLARRGLIDAALVAVPAAAAGPPLGVILASLLIRTNPAASSGVVLTPRASAAVWLATAAVAAGCVAIIALPWLRRPPSPLRRRVNRGRQRSIAAAVYARADLAVVAVAAAAAWQLIHSAGPVATGLDGTLSADPILVLAPVLALVGGALLTLRALPLAARLSDRVAARGRGLVVAAAAWQISRRALRQTGPTLVGVLAVAAAVMAVSQRDSWQQSVQAQASFDVGADLRVNMPPAAPLSLGRVTEVTKAPGVLASTPAVRLTFSLPGGNAATLLALNTAAAARIIPAQAAGPAPSVLRRLATAGQEVGVAVPGRPAALKLTATLGRAALGQPVLFVQLTDAAGISYVLPAGSLPADGKQHALAVTFAAGNHADYPLRITGFSLQYSMSNAFATNDTLAISAGQALATATSAHGREFAVAVPGKPMLSTATVNPDSTPPSIVRAQATPGGGVELVFRGGHAASPGEPASISMSDRYPGHGQPLAAVVTRSFLAATGLRLGGRLQASIDGTTVDITPLAAVRYLPTISAGNPGILVDQRALASALQAAGAPPEGISEWWLRMSSDPLPTGLPIGTLFTSRALIAMALLADPLSLASQQALLAIAIAVLLLAIIGLLVSGASAADRARDVALLDALGMPPGQVARLLGLEQALTAGATSAIGLLFGAALSELIVPAVVLTSSASKPIPPLIVQLPWLLAVVVALAMAALPTLAITLAVPRRSSASAAIRLEDEL
jgi:hypothetical protein